MPDRSKYTSLYSGKGIFRKLNNDNLSEMSDYLLRRTASLSVAATSISRGGDLIRGRSLPNVPTTYKPQWETASQRTKKPDFAFYRYCYLRDQGIYDDDQWRDRYFSYSLLSSPMPFTRSYLTPYLWYYPYPYKWHYPSSNSSVDYGHWRENREYTYGYNASSLRRYYSDYYYDPSYGKTSRYSQFDRPLPRKPVTYYSY